MLYHTQVYTKIASTKLLKARPQYNPSLLLFILPASLREAKNMARLQLLPVLAALYFSLAGVVLAVKAPTFFIEGRVYCDTCRAGFETTATEYIEGAKVRVECKQFLSNAVKQTVEAVTDKSGTYRIELAGDHEEQICEVVLVESPVASCSEITSGRERARILVAGNSGLSSNVRYANSLGFLKETPLPLCGLLLQQYSLGDDK